MGGRGFHEHVSIKEREREEHGELFLAVMDVKAFDMVRNSEAEPKTNLKVIQLSEKAQVPKKGSARAAGSAVDVEIGPNDQALISADLKVADQADVKIGPNDQATDLKVADQADRGKRGFGFTGIPFVFLKDLK